MQHQAILLLFVSSAAAFNTSMYTSESCTGLGVGYDKQVSDGCQTDGTANLAGIVNEWASEEDNKQLLVTYKEMNCCHANMVQIINWKVGCQEVTSGVGSWRILNADDWDSGKAGDNYTCE